jgi:2-polyprenyl-6-methoxyphenol hydroxylase-like FAD-dependent oxidoreductase
MAKRTVEIAGAGLAGLAVGVRLAQLGWKVRMHERNPELRMFGAGIWLWENGLKSLRMLGAYDAATQRAKHIREWRICDPHGRVLMSRLCVPGDGMLLPPRADLYQALIDRAAELGVDIETSSVVADASADGRITLQNGKEYHADLVIAADGAYSRLREAILRTRWIDYGVEAGIRMLIRYQPGDSDDTCTEYWNGPWRLLYNPCTDGENYIFLSAPVNDQRARALPIDRDLWRSVFPHASDLISRFSEASRWDRIVNVRCSTWSSGRVAILGDAAHAMPPNLGQAANMAFTNAMALAQAVTEGDDIPRALEIWEGKHRPLADHVQWWSYIYGLMVGCWPNALLPLRSDLIRFISKSEWFDEGLNRGARTVPAGYVLKPGELPPPLPSHHD